MLDKVVPRLTPRYTSPQFGATIVIPNGLGGTTGEAVCGAQVRELNPQNFTINPARGKTQGPLLLAVPGS